MYFLAESYLYKLFEVILIFDRESDMADGHITTVKRKYRPVCLLSFFDKLLENIMFKRLYSYLTKYDIQFGFRTNHSTIMAIMEIVDNIREELDKRNSVIAVYMT